MSEIHTRPPAVAGMFYTDDPDELQRQVDAFLNNASSPEYRPRAIITPHAGYPYSGATAGIAWASARQRADRIRRVLLLGPSHRVPLYGLATSPATHWRTPLGSIPLDREVSEQLQGLPQVNATATAHAYEHSLEVQVPFIQRLFPDAMLLPLVVGEAAPEEVGEVLEPFWDEEETLIAVSTDLSHFHEYESAQQIDRATTEAIEHFDISAIGPEQACGCRPLCGLLMLAGEQQCRVSTLHRCNSGDATGVHDRVVGYGAYAVH